MGGTGGLSQFFLVRKTLRNALGTVVSCSAGIWGAGRQDGEGVMCAVRSVWQVAALRMIGVLLLEIMSNPK